MKTETTTVKTEARDELEEVWENLLGAWSDFRFIIRRRMRHLAADPTDERFVRTFLVGVDKLLTDERLKSFVDDCVRAELDKKAPVSREGINNMSDVEEP